MSAEDNPPPAYSDISFTGEVSNIYRDGAASPHPGSPVPLTQSPAVASPHPGSPVPLTQSPAVISGNTVPPPNAAPPSYNEVLAAEGTGRFPVIGSRTREILNFYQRNRSTNDNENSTTEEPSSDECSDSSGSFCANAVVFFIIAGIPIAMVIMGVLHMNACPMNKDIPIFMIISGSIACALLLVVMVAGDDKESNSCGNACAGVLLVALVAVNIWGSVLIFQKWNEWGVLKHHPAIGCHNDMYVFGFSLLVIFWLMVPCVFCS